MNKDKISPDHYNADPSGICCWQINRYMGYYSGCIVKYAFRLGNKDPIPDEFGKIEWYITKMLQDGVDDYNLRAGHCTKALEVLLKDRIDRKIVTADLFQCIYDNDTEKSLIVVKDAIQVHSTNN